MLVVFIARLRSQGTYLYPFLDDVLMRAPIKEAAQNATTQTLELLQAHGFVKQKSTWSNVVVNHNINLLELRTAKLALNDNITGNSEQ